jgi:hypothetical protein
MQTVTNLSQFKKLPKGTPIYIENHAVPERSRHTKVFNNYSYFFTVDSNGKESWIFDSVNYPKASQFLFKEGKVHIFAKDGKPFLTIYLDENFINSFPKN